MLKQFTVTFSDGLLRQRILTGMTGSSEWSYINIRNKFKDIVVPKPGNSKYFRRTVHYPDKYTLKPIPTTNLAGRDPKTGRVVVGTLGGGVKHPFLWVDYMREAPEGSKIEEMVLEIIVDPNRSGHIALVGRENKLRYIIATQNMKPGDMIVTSNEMTRIAVRPNEGDAYPLASLPMNTEVCCVERFPGSGAFFARAAGTHAVISRRVEDHIILQIPSKREISVLHNCIAVVGRVSNPIHDSIPIGSPNRLRELGYRPRSGLWHRKTGYHGRKIRRPPPVKQYVMPDELERPVERIKLTLADYPYHLPGTWVPQHLQK